MSVVIIGRTAKRSSCRRGAESSRPAVSPERGGWSTRMGGWWSRSRSSCGTSSRAGTGRAACAATPTTCCGGGAGCRRSSVAWDRATAAEVPDFVLWLRQASKSRRSPRTVSAATAGTVNPVTRKRYLGDGYEPRTMRHSNAVLRSFYEFWIERGEGPLVNPVPLAAAGWPAPNAHHNPLEPFRAEGRLRYNPKIPKAAPRAMPDERWNELFAAMRSHRDRALPALAVSNGARAGELLGLRAVDLDWGEQLVQVTRKGSGAAAVAAGQRGGVRVAAAVPRRARPRCARTTGLVDPAAPRPRRGRRRQPLNYDALRAVFRRVNAAAGHELTRCTTCATPRAADEPRRAAVDARRADHPRATRTCPRPPRSISSRTTPRSSAGSTSTWPSASTGTAPPRRAARPGRRRL